MILSLTQIILTTFLVFALSRVILRFRGGNVSIIGLVFWTFIFGSAITLVLFPFLSIDVAKKIGVGRGVDAVIYSSIILLFYLVFRLYVYIQDLRQEISKLIEKLALKDSKNHDKKISKN